MAMTDPLTKALNRREVPRFAEREVLRASRHTKAAHNHNALHCHTMPVNAVHGHGVGDEVLTRLVRWVTKTIRDEDLLGRPGGEAFAPVLTETEPWRATIPAHRLQDAIGALSFAGKAGIFSITISAGISEPGFADIDILPALERADTPIWGAKQNGRNRAEVAPLTSGGASIAAA